MNVLPEIFNLRIRGIKWLLEEGEFDLAGIMDEVYPQIEMLKKNPRLEVLAENILFALRCNQRVINKLTALAGFSEENVSNSLTQLPSITYDQFVAALAFSIPDQDGAQKFLDWMSTSLCIEFVAIATVTIDEEKLHVSSENINELAFIVSDAAQDYIALATELGLFKAQPGVNETIQLNFDTQFISAQKFLADQGLNDQDWPAA